MVTLQISRAHKHETRQKSHKCAKVEYCLVCKGLKCCLQIYLEREPCTHKVHLPCKTQQCHFYIAVTQHWLVFRYNSKHTAHCGKIAGTDPLRSDWYSSWTPAASLVGSELCKSLRIKNKAYISSGLIRKHFVNVCKKMLKRCIYKMSLIVTSKEKKC